MRRGRAVVALLLALAGLGIAQVPPGPAPVSAQRGSLAAPRVGTALQHDISPPLRALGARAEAPLAADGTSAREAPVARRGPPALAPGARRPAHEVVRRQASLPMLPLFEPGVSFDGISATSFVPPDPNGDVGPDHYVQAVNRSFAVYRKTGAALLGPLPFDALWTGFAPCQRQAGGDPIVLYDALADRWLLTEVVFPNGSDRPPSVYCLAVSTGPDPTQTYYRYAFVFQTTKIGDYPKWAVWPDGYYLAANQFDASGGPAGQLTAVVDRLAVVRGEPAPTTVAFDVPLDNPPFGGLLPADLDGARPPPASSPAYFARVRVSYTRQPDNALEVYELRANWANPAGSAFSGPTVVATAPYDADLCNYATNFNCIPQAGTSQRVDGIGDRLMHRLVYRNFGTHETLLANHTVDVGDFEDHAGVRWYELRRAGGPWTLFQQGTYAPDAHHRWMASIAMDGSGNLALGFSLSSETEFPSIRYAGRLRTDPPGVLRGEAVLQPGGGAQLASNRWGDYTMLAIDPVDDCTFWYTNQYYASSSGASWRTRIGSFRLPPPLCQPANVTPTPTATPTPTPTFTPTPTATPTPAPRPPVLAAPAVVVLPPLLPPLPAPLFAPAVGPAPPPLAWPLSDSTGPTATPTAAAPPVPTATEVPAGSSPPSARQELAPDPAGGEAPAGDAPAPDLREGGGLE